MRTILVRFASQKSVINVKYGNAHKVFEYLYTLFYAHSLVIPLLLLN